MRRSVFVSLALSVMLAMSATTAGVAQTTSAAIDEARDGQHDFDWEIGTWKIHTRRLQHPLSGANDWVDLDGTVVARKIWDGRSNLAEVELDGPSGHIELLSLRLYNPKSHQWSLNFATSKGGTLSVPMVGGFSNGRGEFYDQEEFNGKMILVRLLFTSVGRDSGSSQQEFSADGGKTWETNWVNTYTRVKDEPVATK